MTGQEWHFTTERTADGIHIGGVPEGAALLLGAAIFVVPTGQGGHELAGTGVASGLRIPPGQGGRVADMWLNILRDALNKLSDNVVMVLPEEEAIQFVKGMMDGE